MAQTFSPHPAGMPPHPGFAQGHPMASGHPSSQGQPGGPQQPGQGMPQQIHPMVSAPGGPPATQGGPVMTTLPAGAGGSGVGGPIGPGPSAHALSHLNPGQAQQIFQQQQQQHMAQARKYNPSSVLSFSRLEVMSTRTPCIVEAELSSYLFKRATTSLMGKASSSL